MQYCRSLLRLRIFSSTLIFQQRHAVVGDLRIDVDEVGPEEADLLQRVVADGEDVVAEARGLHQRVLVVAALVAEDVLDVMPLRPSRRA